MKPTTSGRGGGSSRRSKEGGGMSNMRNCGICSWELDPREAAYSMTSVRTTASDVCLMFKLFDYLGEEFFSGVICETCFELVEQIDCFEQNIAGSKEKLKDRMRHHQELNGKNLKPERRKYPDSHRITPLQFEVFRLKCPDGTLPPLEDQGCSLCGAGFPTWADKIRHFLVFHKDDNPFVCPLDNQGINDSLDEHLLKFHEGKTWSKDFSFYDGMSLSAPQKDGKVPLPSTGGEDERCQCAYCGLVCNSEMAFLFHRRFHHEVSFQPFTECPFCPEEFSDFKELRVHVIAYHYGVDKFSLPQEDGEGENFSDCFYFPDRYLVKDNTLSFEQDGRLIKLEEVNGKVPANESIMQTLLKDHLERLQRLPNEITNDVEGESWDITRLKRFLDDEDVIELPGEKKCFSCDSEFNTLFQKVAHRCQFHSPEGVSPYYCHFCMQVFSEESVASKHVIKDHGLPDLIIMQQQQLQNNTRPDSEGKIILSNGHFQCSICGLGCNTVLSYWFHRRSSHSSMSEEYDCDYCHEKSISPSNLRRHIFTIHGRYRFRCPMCLKVWKTVTEFRDHVHHHSMQPLKKITPSKSLSFSAGTTNRSSSYEKKDMLACELCHHIVRGPRMLAKHMQTVHGMKQEVDCVKCGMKFDSYKDLTSHMRVAHTKSAPCQFCGKLFESRQTLDAHIATVHEGKEISKEFMCESCSRTFANKQLLQTHMRCHSDDKKITCKICGKAFKWESSLVSHTRAAHSDMTLTAQYDCKFCGKTFKDKSNLKNHIYTHTGEKPYHCEHCRKGFIRKDLMKSHSATCQR